MARDVLRAGRATSRRITIFSLMVVAEIVVILPSPEWVRAAAAIPLVLLLPGLAILEALQGEERHIPLGDALIWSIIISLGSAVAGGLALNLLGGLTRESWLIYTAIVVTVPTFVSVRTSTAVPVDGSVESVDGPEDVPSRPRGTRTRINISMRNLGSAALGLIVLGASFALSYQSAASTRQRFTQLWMIPAGATPAMTRLHAQLGIQNHEGFAEHYAVQVFGDGGTRPIETWSVTVEDGATWTHDVGRQPGVSLRATLTYRDGGQRHLQYVTLQAPA